MKGVAALRTAKRQPLTAGLIDTPAVVAGPRGISGIDLDHFETRALGFVAEYVEEPRVSPRTVVIAGLPATRPGACPDPVQPLHRYRAASRLQSKPHKLFSRAMLHVLDKSCSPSGDAVKGPRAAASTFGLELAPDPPAMLLLGLEVPGREEMRVVSRGSDREIATARIDSENTARPLLRLFADHGNVKLVAPSFTAALVDELRGLDLPIGRLKVAARKVSAAIGKLLAALYGGDRDDAFPGVDAEVPTPRSSFQVDAPTRKRCRFIELVSIGLRTCKWRQPCGS